MISNHNNRIQGFLVFNLICIINVVFFYITIRMCWENLLHNSIYIKCVLNKKIIFYFPLKKNKLIKKDVNLMNKFR